MSKSNSPASATEKSSMRKLDTTQCFFWRD